MLSMKNKFDFDITYASSAKIYEDFDGTETLEDGGGIVEFADDCGEIDIEFGEEHCSQSMPTVRAT